MSCSSLGGQLRPPRARRYRGPHRGQGRSSSRALHLDRGCGPRHQAAAAGQHPEPQPQPAAGL